MLFLLALQPRHIRLRQRIQELEASVKPWLQLFLHTEHRHPCLMLPCLPALGCWSYASMRCNATLGKRDCLLNNTALRPSPPRKVALAVPRHLSLRRSQCTADVTASFSLVSCSNTFGKTITRIVRLFFWWRAYVEDHNHHMEDTSTNRKSTSAHSSLSFALLP